MIFPSNRPPRVLFTASPGLRAGGRSPHRHSRSPRLLFGALLWPDRL